MTIGDKESQWNVYVVETPHIIAVWRVIRLESAPKTALNKALRALDLYLNCFGKEANLTHMGYFLKGIQPFGND